MMVMMIGSSGKKNKRKKKTANLKAGTFAPCRTLKIILSDAQHSRLGN